MWLMRQAGRYMAAFREYSDRIGFRERSETASIAIELSLQPWRAFQVRTSAACAAQGLLTSLPAVRCAHICAAASYIPQHIAAVTAPTVACAHLAPSSHKPPPPLPSIPPSLPQTDGVIMFSDILTPLPALGIEFDVIKGKGPRIDNPIDRCGAAGSCLTPAIGRVPCAAVLLQALWDRPPLLLPLHPLPFCPLRRRSMDAVRALRPMDDPLSSLPFVHETLSTLRREIDGSGAALLGFIGTPWTLAAYSVEVGWGRAWRRGRLGRASGKGASRNEARVAAPIIARLLPAALHASPTLPCAVQGKADRNCRRTKTMMFNNPAVLHALLEHLTDALIVYVGYQIEAGAQVRAPEAGLGVWRRRIEGSGHWPHGWEQLVLLKLPAPPDQPRVGTLAPSCLPSPPAPAAGGPAV